MNKNTICAVKSSNQIWILDDLPSDLNEVCKNMYKKLSKSDNVIQTVGDLNRASEITITKASESDFTCSIKHLKTNIEQNFKMHTASYDETYNKIDIQKIGELVLERVDILLGTKLAEFQLFCINCEERWRSSILVASVTLTKKKECDVKIHYYNC